MPWRERPPYTRKPFRGRMVGSSNLPRPTTLPCLPPVFTRAGELAESAVSTAVLKVVKFRNRSRDSVPQEARGLVGTIRYRASFEGFQFSPFPILSNIIGLRTERSEEHTSELQSRRDIVCRLLLEKKKTSES